MACPIAPPRSWMGQGGEIAPSLQRISPRFVTLPRRCLVVTAAKNGDRETFLEPSRRTLLKGVGGAILSGTSVGRARADSEEILNDSEVGGTMMLDTKTLVGDQKQFATSYYTDDTPVPEPILEALRSQAFSNAEYKATALMYDPFVNPRKEPPPVSLVPYEGGLRWSAAAVKADKDFLKSKLEAAGPRSEFIPPPPKDGSRPTLDTLKFSRAKEAYVLVETAMNKLEKEEEYIKYNSDYLDGLNVRDGVARGDRKWIQHAVLKVRDLQQMVNFWCRGFGLRVLRTRTSDDGTKTVFVGNGPETLEAENGGMFSLEIVEDRANAKGAMVPSREKGFLTPEDLSSYPKAGRLAFFQMALEYSPSRSAIKKHGGEIFYGYGYYDIRGPENVWVRCAVASKRRRDPFVAVAIELPNLEAVQKAAEFYMDTMGMTDEYVPQKYNYVPPNPAGTVELAYNGEDKDSVSIFLIPGLPLIPRKFSNDPEMEANAIGIYERDKQRSEDFVSATVNYVSKKVTPIVNSIQGMFKSDEDEPEEEDGSYYTDAEERAFVRPDLDPTPFVKLAVVSSDVSGLADKVQAQTDTSGAKVDFVGEVPGIGTKVAVIDDPNGFPLVAVDDNDFESELKEKSEAKEAAPLQG